MFLLFPEGHFQVPRLFSGVYVLFQPCNYHVYSVFYQEQIVGGGWPTRWVGLATIQATVDMLHVMPHQEHSLRVLDKV